MQISWAARMRASFGAPFLCLVALVYFTQGFRSFAWTAVSYQMKDVLKLSPSASQVVVSISHAPWSIKPIYGILSDCIPINGRRRLPYMVMAIVFSLSSWLVLGLATSVRSSRTSFTASLTFQNLGTAMADVVVDAMIAEAVRSELGQFAGDLQSLSWSAMAFGGICGSLLGGYTLSRLGIQTIFLFFAVLSGIQLLPCAFIEEATSELQRLPSEDEQVHLEIKEDDNCSSNRASLTKASKRSKRKSKRKNRKNLKTNSRYDNKQHGSLLGSYYISLKSTICSLVLTFKQPIILRPMAWFFLSNITVPSLSTAMFYYLTEVLKFEASFLGMARVVGFVGLMLGTFAYNRYLKHKKLREVLMYAHVGLGISSLLDIVLVSKLNSRFDIPDKYMVLWGSAFGDAIRQFRLMPFLLLSGRLCPPGIEGTLFALFMSINNLGSNLGSVFGAALASVLNISSSSYENLTVGLFIQLLATLFPITFLFLIPKEATGLAS